MAAKAAGRDASIHDLVTREIVIAFAGLALVALLAAIVRRLLASHARLGNAASRSTSCDELWGETARRAVGNGSLWLTC